MPIMLSPKEGSGHDNRQCKGPEILTGKSDSGMLSRDVRLQAVAGSNSFSTGMMNNNVHYEETEMLIIKNGHEVVSAEVPQYRIGPDMSKFSLRSDGTEVVIVERVYDAPFYGMESKDVQPDVDHDVCVYEPGAGNNLYEYKSEFGKALVFDPAGNDALTISGNFREDKIFFSLEGPDLMIDIDGGGSVRILQQTDPVNAIERIQLSGGRSLNADDIANCFAPVDTSMLVQDMTGYATDKGTPDLSGNTVTQKVSFTDIFVNDCHEQN